MTQKQIDFIESTQRVKIPLIHGAMNVVTNSKKVEPFDIGKIRRVIAYACEGLDVNPLELESKIDIVFKDGMSTSDIQKNLIQNARTLITPKTLDWNIVAGRLWTMDIWKKTDGRVIHLKAFLSKMFESGIYAHPGLLVYSSEELDELNSVLDPYRDFAFSYSACAVAYNQYLLPGENIYLACMTNAMIVASVETSPKARIEFAKLVYDALSLRKISLASPWWINLRKGTSIASCFITRPNDDLKSITKNWADASLISKNNGGDGIVTGKQIGRAHV